MNRLAGEVVCALMLFLLGAAFGAGMHAELTSVHHVTTIQKGDRNG